MHKLVPLKPLLKATVEKKKKKKGKTLSILQPIGNKWAYFHRDGREIKLKCGSDLATEHTQRNDVVSFKDTLQACDCSWFIKLSRGNPPISNNVISLIKRKKEY